MDFKKGSWNPSKAFDITDLANLLDDKSAKKISDDLKYAMPPKPKKSECEAHNPFVKASDYGKKGQAGHKKAASRGNSQDRDLMSSMMSRLTALEKVNRSLKQEIKEKSIKIESLEKENEILTASSNSNYHKKYTALQGE